MNLRFFLQLLEYIGGERDALPQGASKVLGTAFCKSAILMILLLLIYAFSGQSSKFIYIDF